MKSKPPGKRIFLFATFVMLCIASREALLRYAYPYGRRPGGISLPGIFISLMAYAADHEGWFPRNDLGPYAALRELYPYCPSGRELAGLSGNLAAITAALQAGKPLDPALTSWTYVPGFKVGDPEELAILWESNPGLNYAGRRNSFGGRAVLLLGGTITNVPSASWEAFAGLQDQLRHSTLANRSQMVN